VRHTGQDRTVWNSSPTEPQTARELERLRDDDSTLQVTANSSGVFEVTGLVPEFINVPAGIQQFYVTPVMQELAINMTEKMVLPPEFSYYIPVEQDSQNVFNKGSDSFILYRRDNEVGVFNFANNTAEILEFPQLSSSSNDSYVIGNSFALILIYPQNNPTGKVGIIENGVAREVSYSFPSGMTRILAKGIIDDNTFAILFTSNIFSSDAPGTVRVGFYNLNGNTVGTTAAFSVNNANAYGAFIEHGRVFFRNRLGEAYVMSATPSSQFTYLGVLPVSPVPNTWAISNTTSDGYIFTLYRDASANRHELQRMDLSTGDIDIFEDIFHRPQETVPGGPGIIIYNIIVAINKNKVVSAGTLRSQEIETPLYSAIVLDGATAYVSDSFYTGYTRPLATFSLFFPALGVADNGNVVYTLITPSPYDDYLVKVTGP
jgi:hypothetical protein